MLTLKAFQLECLRDLLKLSLLDLLKYLTLAWLKDLLRECLRVSHREFLLVTHKDLLQACLKDLPSKCLRVSLRDLLLVIHKDLLLDHLRDHPLDILRDLLQDLPKGLLLSRLLRLRLSKEQPKRLRLCNLSTILIQATLRTPTTSSLTTLSLISTCYQVLTSTKLSRSSKKMMLSLTKKHMKSVSLLRLS